MTRDVGLNFNSKSGIAYTKLIDLFDCEKVGNFPNSNEDNDMRMTS